MPSSSAHSGMQPLHTTPNQNMQTNHPEQTTNQGRVAQAETWQKTEHGTVRLGGGGRGRVLFELPNLDCSHRRCVETELEKAYDRHPWTDKQQHMQSLWDVPGWHHAARQHCFTAAGATLHARVHVRTVAECHNRLHATYRTQLASKHETEWTQKHVHVA